MRNGFKFKDVHSSLFGISVKTKSRPIRPAVRTFFTEVPYRDGEYDFSSANPYGHEFYSSRTFSVSIGVCAENLTALQRKLTQLSKWLCGKGELIFDDIPLAVWIASVDDEIIYMPEHEGRKAVIDVSFRAEPFSQCIFNSLDGPCLDVPVITIGDCVPIGIDGVYTYTFSQSGDLSVINIGDRYARPVIAVDGNAEALVLSCGDKALSFTAQGGVKIDFEKQCVTDETGTLKVSGEFFELPQGESTVHIENSNTDSLTVTVCYTPKFMYNVYFDEMDWGDGDA